MLTLPHPVTVVADGRRLWDPVDIVETQAAAKLVATPKLDEHVYQIAALKNPAAYPLLEGRVRSYRHGSYVGDSRLRHQGVGAPFEISLGIDEELKAERKTLDAKDKSAGRSQLDQTHLPRLPHQAHQPRRGPGDDRAARESSRLQDRRRQGGALAKPTTAGYKLDAPRGFITWTVTLVNGEWRNVDLAYAIHLPDNWQVPGR